MGWTDGVTQKNSEKLQPESQWDQSEDGLNRRPVNTLSLRPRNGMAAGAGGLPYLTGRGFSVFPANANDYWILRGGMPEIGSMGVYKVIAGITRDIRTNGYLAFNHCGMVTMLCRHIFR